MPTIKELLTQKRLLFYERGFTRHILHVEDEPKKFIGLLSTQLRAIAERPDQIPNGGIFHTRLHAEFENGRFPVVMDFTFQFTPQTQQLNIVSLTAELFDVAVTYDLRGIAADQIPIAGDVLRDLKINLRQDITKHAAAFIAKTGHTQKITKR